MASNEFIMINDSVKNIDEPNEVEIETNEVAEINGTNENVNEAAETNETDENASNNDVLVDDERDDDYDDDGDGVADENVNDNDIPFIFTAGLRAPSKLIYTTTEKQFYRKDKKCGDHCI